MFNSSSQIAKTDLAEMNFKESSNYRFYYNNDFYIYLFDWWDYIRNNDYYEDVLRCDYQMA